MSPKKKSPYPRRKKPSHADKRHAPTPPPAPPDEPTTDPRAEACRLLTELVGRLGASGAEQLIAFARVLADRDAAGVAEEYSAPEAVDVPVLAVPKEWLALGADLAARGRHRSRLALHVASALAAGGPDVSREEEDQLAAWFGGIVAEAIERTGGPQDANRAASAIWWLIAAGDWIPSCHAARPSRCPALDAIGCPGDRGFVAGLQAAAPDYMRTVLAGACGEDVDEIRKLARAGVDELDEYRPFAGPYVLGDSPSAQTLESALCDLTRARPTAAQVCAGFENWARAFEQISREHNIPAVNRIGAVVWLARVALAERTGRSQ